MFIARREFLIGGGLALAAPFVVKASSLMPVRVYDPLVNWIEIRAPGLKGSMEIMVRGEGFRPQPLSAYEASVRSGRLAGGWHLERHQWWPVLAYPTASA